MIGALKRIHCPKCGNIYLSSDDAEGNVEFGLVKCSYCLHRFVKEELGIDGKKINIKTSKLPKSLPTYCKYGMEFVRLSITDLDYSYENGIFHFRISGKKIYDEYGINNFNECKIGWVLSNSQRIPLEAQYCITHKLGVGDYFEEEFSTSYPVFVDKEKNFWLTFNPIYEKKKDF